MTLSESELDELAEKLDGYTIASENPPKSTGRVEVILRKTGKNNALRPCEKSPCDTRRKAGESWISPVRWNSSRSGVDCRRNTGTGRVDPSVYALCKIDAIGLV